MILASAPLIQEKINQGWMVGLHKPGNLQKRMHFAKIQKEFVHANAEFCADIAKRWSVKKMTSAKTFVTNLWSRCWDNI